MTYVRQTSTLGGKILAIGAAGMFLMVAVIMTGPVAVFGFILYGGNMIALLFWAIGNSWKKMRLRRAGRPLPEDADPPYLQVRQGLGSAYLSGFIIAVPLSLIVLVVGYAIAPTGLGSLLAKLMKEVVPFFGKQTYAAVALTLVIDLAFVVWGVYHSFWTAPADAFKGTGEVEEKGLAMGLLIFCVQLFFVSLCIAAPIGTLLIGIAGLGAPWFIPCVTKGFYLLACGPAIGFGAAIFVRGMWMHHLKIQIENLATSDPRSAAVGLVEMRGTVQHVNPAAGDQPVIRISQALMKRSSDIHPFYLESDDGARVLVDLPRFGQAGREDHLLLEKDAQGEGEFRVQRLMPGARVYVIGSFTPGAGDQPPSLEPWIPPRSGLALSGLNTFLDRAILEIGKDAADTFPVGKLIEQALGIQYLEGVFFVTDADEHVARRLLFREWNKHVAIGLFYMIGSGALLALVLSGTAQHLLSVR